jgi:hypothetical protein
LRLKRRPGVVDDARGDELGREPRFVLVVHAGGIRRDIRVRIRQQPVLLLEILHRHRIGDQQNVGLRRAGFHFSAQLRDDARCAVAHEGDVDLRIFRLERVDGLLRVLVGLARIENELALLRACKDRRRGDQHRGKQQANGDAHGKACVTNMWSATSHEIKTTR